MKYPNLQPILNSVLRYAMPSLAAAWLFSRMLETKHLEGWYAFQDNMHRADKPFFSYPTAEFAVATALILVAFGLVKFGPPKIGPLIGAAFSLAATLYVLVLWIGMTV